jgi:hypothetical protein
MGGFSNLALCGFKGWRMWGEGLVFLWRLDEEEEGMLRDAGDFFLRYRSYS